jgi:hypothetical protein
MNILFFFVSERACPFLPFVFSSRRSFANDTSSRGERQREREREKERERESGVSTLLHFLFFNLFVFRSPFSPTTITSNNQQS